jgi:peptidoglycan hydrolase CwlO-like protein
VAASLVCVVALSFLGLDAPDAVRRSDRTTDVVVLTATLARVKGETSGIDAQIDQLRARIQMGADVNTELTSAIASQLDRIAKLRKKIVSLKKDIAAIGG